MKILFIQQKMIGDVLVGTVICRAIKMQFPDSEVHYMVHPNTTAVVENNPYIDKIIIFDPQKIKGFTQLAAFGRSLKNNGYDTMIDSYGKWESIIPAYFSGAKKRIGFYKWYTSIFYTKTVKPAKNVSGSAIYHRLQLAEALTNNFPKVDFPKIYLSKTEIDEAADKLSAIRENAKLIMVSVLGSSTDKSLPADQMAKTLDIVAQGNVKILFNFIPPQKAQAEEILNLCTKETAEKVIFAFYMKGLRSFLAILSQCDALVGNEGGAVNMAKALDIPTFTIFSPWINKSSWDMKTDKSQHVAVHLQDYFPELYGNRHPKEFKGKWLEYYQKLRPELYSQKLTAFVKKIIAS